MSQRFQWTLCCSCGLLILLVALFAVPATHARAAAHLPASGGGGTPCRVEYGVSYDADTYSTVYSDGNGQELPVFSFGAFEPLIGAIVCANQDDLAQSSWVNLVFIGLFPDQPGWYNLLTTVAGQTTQTTLDSSFFPGYIDPYNKPSNLLVVTLISRLTLPIGLRLQVHQPYSVQVQYCVNGAQGPSCSPWSPHLQFTVYANNTCLSGYVPRLANPYDQVCVTPAEQAQVAYDNSQIDNRIDSGTVSGEVRCIRGYVWRHAFGGDEACVTLAQHNQVVQDNSLAPSRIIAP